MDGTKISAKSVSWDFAGYVATDTVLDADLKELEEEILESGGEIKSIVEVDIYEHELTYTGVQ